MPITFLTTVLLIVSILTNLTVEGIKNMFPPTINYSSNALAAICSVLISAGISIFYIIINAIPFTAIVFGEIIILMYLGFLVATVGYDKVVQMIQQFQAIKGGTK